VFSGPELFLQDLAVILLSATLGAFVCSRIGLSPVVGYLLAGLIVGTPEIAFPYISDTERIEIIAQLGIVFLMFSIGLQFQFKRIRELGIQVVLATILTALIMLTAVRLASGYLGLSEVAGLVVAGVFMNSSSAIISKVLQESNIHHQRPGRVALGITLMEDVVSVIMLAVIGSYLLTDAGGATRSPAGALGLLLGFVLLVGFLGMLLVPKLFRLAGKDGRGELLSVLTGGMVLLVALAAVGAGFSLALGAFLFGVVVSETRQRATVERSFQSLKDIFLTVFFVTVGMLVDIHQLPDALGWIALGTVVALAGRSVAAFVALIITGEQPRRAAQSALCLTPIGEFSFILAGIAVAGGIFSEKFQVIAVGTAFLTSIISPLLATHSQRLTQFLEPGSVGILDRFHESYQKLLSAMGGTRSQGILWRLLRKPVIQSVLEMAIITTVLIFSGGFFELIRDPMQDWIPVSEKALRYGFWILIGIACFIPLVAVWRNLSAAAMIIAEYADSLHRGNGKFVRAWMIPLKTTVAIAFLVWTWNVLPHDLAKQWLLAGIGVSAAIVIPLFWRPIVLWHSQIEIALQDNLQGSRSRSARSVFEGGDIANQGIVLDEFEVPDGCKWAGRTIEDTRLRSETGCSIVGIERHGMTLPALGPRTHIFPGDELLLLGTKENIQKGRERMALLGGESQESGSLHDLLLESQEIVKACPVAYRSLEEMNWPRLYGVHVVAIMRNGQAQTTPDADTVLLPGDVLLLLGRSQDIGKLRATLLPPETQV